jgi:GTP-binding protein HflX
VGRGRRRHSLSFDEEIGEVARGARALVVCPDIRGARDGVEPEARLEEAKGLAQAIGLVVADAFVLPLRQIRPATLFGEGQIERIATECELEDAELVIVDGSLTGIQQRNLEEKLKRKVIDRTGLILEIFGERAATAEGRLQVELAHLDYQQSRLVRSWTHLERQRGGFGFLGGPGETQIEADRRMIRDRMARLRRELDQVRRTRALHRKRRGRAPWPVIALVGYTNAGKSTLFNRLTGADVMAEDLLFATLDPTMRVIKLPGGRDCVISDTVGFVSDLPTHLVAAFRATLEEVVEADLIVHVRDIAHPDSERQRTDVEEVLTALGAIEEGGGTPMIEALNKIDALPLEQRGILQSRTSVGPERARQFPVSALSGEGVEPLLIAIEDLLSKDAEAREVSVPLSDGATIAWLYRHGEVRSRHDDGEVARLTVALDAAASAQFERRQSESGAR